MPEGPLTSTPATPFGLKYNRGYRARFWLRPESSTFAGLYAVHFAATDDGVRSTSHTVHGYLGSFDFDWCNPAHIAVLIVRNRINPARHELFGRLLSSSGCGEWLLCNAADAGAATSSSDALYVRQRCQHDQTIDSVSGVYFVSNGRGAVKIGFSDECMGRRFSALQTANADALAVVAYIADPHPLDLEKQLHMQLKSKRIRGEWFAMSDGEAVAIALGLGGCALDPAD